MQSFQIILNRAYTSTTTSNTSGVSLVGDYYLYQNSNGGGVVNFSNVRGFLNDQKNIQITKDFFAYLTGSTTRAQTMNIVNSDQKLSNVFNDYYNRLIKSAKTGNQGPLISFENASNNISSNVDVNPSSLPGSTSNKNNFSITIVNSNDEEQGVKTSVNFTSNNSEQTSFEEISLNTLSSFNSVSSVENSPIIEVPKFSMTATIAKNLAGGFKSVEKIFYSAWASEITPSLTKNQIYSYAINQGMNTIPLSIKSGIIQTIEKPIWVDTTKEESYYVTVYIKRNTNQISRNDYSPNFVRIPKKTINSYPEYSAFTQNINENLSTKINTILSSFVRLNLETNESLFYASPSQIISSEPIDLGGGSSPSGSA
jgi:hypothetical protein